MKSNKVSIKKILLFCFCVSIFLFTKPVLGQVKVEIFADVTGNDTLQKLITILTEQLKKGEVKETEVKGTSAYSGKGIYIRNTGAADKVVKIPAKLIDSGIEAFAINGTEKTVQIFANSNAGIGHGIFSYLELLGYRYYFAHPDWYIVPSKPTLFRKLSILSKPDLDQRKIVYGYGTGSVKADQDFAFWQLANKMGGSLNAIYGHSYDEIMLRNKEEFKKHPEWFYPPTVKGELRTEPKFDVSNEGLVQIVIKDVTDQIELSLKNKTQAYKMITLGPSDGTGTCNTPACQKLGSNTDRVFYLVNRVAKAIQKKYPSTKIGCLAYSEYISPPSDKVEPNVYVAITTAFNNSKYTTEQLINEWNKKGAIVGLYDYFSWYAWDFDIPGQSLASQPYKIAENIRKYQKKGLKGYDAESSIGWVSKGLGYFTAAKVMWEGKADVSSIRNEFFANCFGKAASTIRKIWDEWEAYGFTQVREGDLANWIDLIYQAEKQETDPAVKNRFFQIKSYLHYLYLYRVYQFNKTEGNMMPLLNYGFRMLDYGSVSGYPAFFELGNRSNIPGMGWGADAKWRYNKTPVTNADLNASLQQDRGQLKIKTPVALFTPASNFKNIPSLATYRSMVADSVDLNNAFWLTDEWVLQLKSKGALNYIDFAGDFIADKNNPQPIRIKIYPYTATGDIGTATPVFSYDYTAMQVKERISLGGLDAGYYTMVIEDPVKVYRLSFSRDINQSIVMRPSRHLKTTSINYGFIYVPEGTTKFNVIKSRTVKFITPTGRVVDLNTDKEEDLQVEVRKGETGLWRIKLLSDRLFIEGIPPYMGTSAAQMLIPADIK
jgi:Domain of unknown function (DUF4838)